jgi:hypothetical protein
MEMMNDDKDIKNILLEILKWTKIEGIPKVKQILENELDTDTKKIIYESSDGLSSPEIAQLVGVDPKTVRDYWKDWGVLGIVEIHPEFKKRYRRVFSLREVGIEIPQCNQKQEQKETLQEKKPKGEEDE